MKTRLVNGFLWLIVTDKAKEIYNSKIFELYVLHEDGSESLIDSSIVIDSAIKLNLDIAIEINHLENL